jgi:hypothetical protein
MRRKADWTLSEKCGLREGFGALCVLNGREPQIRVIRVHSRNSAVQQYVALVQSSEPYAAPHPETATESGFHECTSPAAAYDDSEDCAAAGAAFDERTHAAGCICAPPVAVGRKRRKAGKEIGAAGRRCVILSIPHGDSAGDRERQLEIARRPPR